jgi:DNA invertase Pin-like site-specific DNA recombinase
MTKYVAYYRASTKRQGQSGLGLEAQQALVSDFAKDNPIIAEFTEVESGRNDTRPVMAEALAYAKQSDAILVVAKQDRLARKVLFIAQLIESGVPFVIADNPHADKFRLHIEACINEDEAEKISKRTKDALAAAKARGVKLGCPNPRAGGLASGAARREKTQRVAAKAMPIITALRDAGASLRAVATKLNEAGVPSAMGGAWHATSVRNLINAMGD